MIHSKQSAIPPTAFVLIALPGTGKTTACQEIAKTLKHSKLADLQVVLIDEQIKKRVTLNDPVIRNFTKAHPGIDKTIFDNQFKGSVSSKIMKSYGEPVWRTLEADFCVDILNQSKSCIIDLGGKMFLNSAVRKAAKNKSMTAVYLYANRDTIENHLSNNDNWKQRSNYRDAGPAGWRKLLDQHARERTPQMLALSDVAIDVSDMSPKAVSKEILYRVYEFTTLREKNKASYGVKLNETDLKG